MIQEIVNFVDHLEAKSPDIFSENLELKEGIYVFLEKDGDELVVKNENIFKVGKNTERNALYYDFLKLYSVSEMVKNKSMNSIEKIFIDIGSPFAISISGKGIKPDSSKDESSEIRKTKQTNAISSYLKAISTFLDPVENYSVKIDKWVSQFKNFVENRLLDFLLKENGKLETEDGKYKYDFTYDGKKLTVKDSFMFYFYMREPALEDYNIFYSKYLDSKVFLNDLKKGESHGISNDLNVGNVTNKPFTRHKTGPFEVNYKIKGNEASAVYKFFRLQYENKILPNPFPLFVDESELSSKAITFYNKNKKVCHKEIIEELIRHKKDDLQNYYLIYFNNKEKGSRVVDFDFVPNFRYRLYDVILEEPFPIGGKYKNLSISNIFNFQYYIFNKVFNNQLVSETKDGGLWIKYFDDMKVDSKFGNATETIVNIFYQYRKSIYDYVYKSKQQSITNVMFQDMIQKSIFDDIKHDKEHDKTYRIKEKLNIWFSLYNYFINQIKPENMASKIPELIERCKLIANNNDEHLSDDPKEFAFMAGQIIYFLLDKSESGNKTHAMLEPFLQKVNAEQLQIAISNLIGIYKHSIDFGKGRFERLAKEVLAYETYVNMKEMQRFVLAGYFAEAVIYEKKK
mgnify:CR=1 FL=1